MEESYRELLKSIMMSHKAVGDAGLEYAIEEAHKVVAAKRKFEKAMDRAYTNLKERRIADNF